MSDEPDLDELLEERDRRMHQELIESMLRPMSDEERAEMTARQREWLGLDGTLSLADLPADWTPDTTPLTNIQSARERLHQGYDLGAWHRTVAADAGYPAGDGIPLHLDIIECGLPHEYPKHMEWQCWCGRTWYREADEFWWTPVLYLGGPVVWRKVPR